MGALVVVGSYNVGLTIIGPELPMPGQTVLGHTFDIGPGGKGSNQAIGARRLGADVRLVVKLGHDRFADDARELFERERLLSPGVLATEAHTGVGLILVDDEGRNMISVEPGANALLTEADLNELDGLFEGASHLLCQLEATTELFAAAARRAAAAGAEVILNPAPARPLPVDAYQLVDILTPNETELGVLTDRPAEDDEQLVEGAERLLDKGVGEVIVTLGDRGAVWVRPDAEPIHFPSTDVVAVDTTGAGDAFNAGLAAGLSRGNTTEEAIRLGVRAGAFCVTRLGVIAGLPTGAELDHEIPIE